ncbi:hypothetical protein COLO4_20706 [Corchorus olitorius]|uniref:Uncharacterized protein n=1 Tax=Corchorus olitorius TaxID=93759 RepID=A0A1R3IXN0_9ROSI|nr:hypothetical protein COLO4_20706 [Corchorus olitorius]
MAFTLRSVKVPPNSVSLEEARSRVFDFFRTACRSIPSIMDIYNLDDVVTKSQLRSTIAAEIRKNAHVTNPKFELSGMIDVGWDCEGKSWHIACLGFSLLIEQE